LYNYYPVVTVSLSIQTEALEGMWSLDIFLIILVSNCR
jgi:hypothetical protein